MGPAASNAVPALILTLGDTDPEARRVWLRAGVATALGEIGPSAGNAVPALKLLLNDPDPDLCWKAAFAIWQIDGDRDVALPVMLRSYPGCNRAEKWHLVRDLGEMGPRAKDAVPLLKADLTNEATFPDARREIESALGKIDPAR
jgi:HEAT repeat protein